MTAMVLGAFNATYAAEELNWEASDQFQFKIEAAVADRDYSTPAQDWVVTVTFSITNPKNGSGWDIKSAPEFNQPKGVSRLAVDIGWTTEEYANTGANGLAPVYFKTVNGVSSGGGAGIGAALPVNVNAVAASAPVSGHPGWYTVKGRVPGTATKTAAVLLEGHPAVQTMVNGVATWMRVPVKSAYRYVSLTDSTPVERREIVDINKCQKCHDGGVHGDVTVPRLSLHGGNRTEELHVCTVCHNPSQTDIPYRVSGAEVSVDFKRMVHSIHAGGFRETPFIVTGFGGAATDFSDVRFPAELRDCTKCHIDDGVRGTFELPLAATVRGSTIKTGSVPGSYVDLDPTNDRKITPTAAVCSSCHDKSDVRYHITSKTAGGSFSALPGINNEHCVNCHGPGAIRDVRRMHQIGGVED